MSRFGSRRAIRDALCAAAPLLIAATGCRMEDCTPPDPSRPVSASETAAGPRGSVRGEVLAIATGLPVPAAQIRLVPGDTVWHGVTHDGRFAYANLVPGAVLLEVQAPGFSDANISLRVRTDSAVAVVTALASAPPTPRAGECGQSPTGEPTGQ